MFSDHIVKGQGQVFLMLILSAVYSVSYNPLILIDIKKSSYKLRSNHRNAAFQKHIAFLPSNQADKTLTSI